MPKGPIEAALGGAGGDGGDGNIFDGADAGGSYGIVRPESLLACANCGVVFLKKKIQGKDPDPALAGVPAVTCPVCLTTHGWEEVR